MHAKSPHAPYHAGDAPAGSEARLSESGPYPRTIAGDGRHETEAKRSRFICTLVRVADEGEAKTALDRIRREFPDANHNCFAYILGERGERQKASDDGEPAGTAGVPILETIRRHDVVDVLAVVTRYFGGTKLGTGGLIRAYGQAVSGALEAVGIVERRPLEIVTVRVGYDDAGRIERLLRGSPHPPATIDYGAEATFVLHLAPEDVPPFRDWLAEISAGALAPEVTGSAVVDVPV